jgi:hypothetical protein
MIGSAPSFTIDIVQKFRTLSYRRTGLEAASLLKFRSSQEFFFLVPAVSIVCFLDWPKKKVSSFFLCILTSAPQASGFNYVDGISVKLSFIIPELHQLAVYAV